MPNYVPGDKPTVPGHETVVRIVKVGPKVTRFKVGERYLVQTDYRWLPTANSNSAFGYNFEGALQEYVLVDERVITAPDGESMLIPAPEDLSASAIALVRTVGVRRGCLRREAAPEAEGRRQDARCRRDEGRAEPVDNSSRRYGKPADITLGRRPPSSPI